MGYTLIVCEKPTASAKIAAALAEGKPEEVKKDGSSYFKIKRKGEDIVIVPAVGHLFVLDEADPKAKWSYPVFEVDWKPTYAQKGNTWAKKYFTNIESLVKGAKVFISACDYDIEGSVIAWNILRFICKVKDGRRMKFSTLTPGDLVEAFDGASPHLDFPQIEAGLARHQMDWYFGINLSRALTLSLEHVGGFWTLSTGRVQGPTLKLLCQRQKQIEAFRPKPYWEIELLGKIDGKEITASHAKDKFWKQEEADAVIKKCAGKDGKVSALDKQKRRQSPPTPFDLTTLQRDSFSLFGYSPKRTLDIAQSLYEGALISYPRTSSQKLPDKIGFRKILSDLAEQGEYKSLVDKIISGPLKPNEGKKTDPAHPAIYPTGHKPSRLSAQQKKLYDLIVKRFLAVFGEPAIREQSRITIMIEGEEFHTHGVRTIKPGWIALYHPYARFKEQAIPDVKEEDPLANEKIERLDKETQPPGRYSQASILKEMEDLGLGTKATRAGILQTLYDRGYIREQSIEVTDLGAAVVKALEQHCPEIISVELTKRFDEEMEQIEEGKLKREQVIKGAENELRRILADFKSHEKEIGNHIKDAVREYEKEIHTLGTCNKCGKGELKIMHSRRTGKRFVGCSNYPKCHNSFPLPQHGYVEVISRKCKCGLGLIQVRAKGRRPWRFCVVDKFEYYEKKKPAEGDSEKNTVKAASVKAAKGAAPVKAAARKAPAKKRAAKPKTKKTAAKK